MTDEHMPDPDRDPADRKPWENPYPQMVACLGCGDPLDGMQVMQAVVKSEVVKPLCSICFNIAAATS
jgi:hypothetical protein